MPKLIIMKGLPASGKSAKAKEILEASGNAIRLNRDLLRTMLHFDKWTGKNESLTRNAERSLAKEFLFNDYVVIIDDTNLNPSVQQSWKDLGNEMKAKVETIELDTPLSECVLRDSERPNPVGKSVIVGMARQYGLYQSNKKDVIVDIDGTVADLTHRLKYIQQDPKDWNSFFGNMANDVPIHDNIDRIQYLSQDNNIVFVSGRPEDYRAVTEKWLGQFIRNPYQALFMRKSGDKRPDTEVKQQILDTYFDKTKIKLVIDDRPSVIRMWRSNGLEVMDVGNGVEF